MLTQDVIAALAPWIDCELVDLDDTQRRQQASIVRHALCGWRLAELVEGRVVTSKGSTDVNLVFRDGRDVRNALPRFDLALLANDLHRIGHDAGGRCEIVYKSGRRITLAFGRPVEAVYDA